PNSSTEPSAAALATNWWAMLPPAPPLLSTTTDWPMFSPSFLAIRRAAASAAPPAAKPTTSVTGFLGGKSWAVAVPASSRDEAASAVARSSWRLFMGVSLGCCRQGGIVLRSISAQPDRVGLAFFHRMAQQRCGAEDAVGELAVG